MTARVSLLKSRASLTCFRACSLPGRAKDLSAPRYLKGIKIALNTKSYIVKGSGFCADEGGPPAWGGLGEVLTTPPCKTLMLRNTHMRDACSGDKTFRR